MTDQKGSNIAARDWRADINGEARLKIVENILEKLKEQLPASELDPMTVNKITDIAENFEKDMFHKANTMDLYVKGICRKMNRLENNCQLLDGSSVKPGGIQQSSSMQNLPGIPSNVNDKAVTQMKTKEIYVSQPLSQMANQQQYVEPPYHVQQQNFPQSKVVPVARSSNLVNHQSPHIISRDTRNQQLLQQPHEQLHRQKLNARAMLQTHQPFGMQNQSSVIHPQNVNSPYQQKWSSQRHVSGVQISHSNGNSAGQVKQASAPHNFNKQLQEIVGDGFQPSTSLHQHLSLNEQERRHGMLNGISAAPTENPPVDNWYHQANLELQSMKETHLPVLKKAYQKASEECLKLGQTERIQKQKQFMAHIEKMFCFFRIPRDKMIKLPKERFHQIKESIMQFVENIRRSSLLLVNEQQPGFSQSHVNNRFQAMSSASIGSPDSSSSPAPRQIVSSRQQPNIIVSSPSSSELSAENRNMLMLQKKQHNNTLMAQPKSIKQELQSPWTQQKPTVEIQAINTPPQIQISSQIDKQTVPKYHSSSSYGRASPSTSLSPSSITAEIGTKPSNVCSNQHSQTGFAVKLHNTETEIQVLSHEMRSSSTLNEPTNSGSNHQILAEISPIDRLLKAVEKMSKEELKAAVFEINLVGNMNDTMAKISPLEEAIDLRLEKGNGFSNNLKRRITATALNEMPSLCSEVEMSEQLTASSRAKKRKTQLDNTSLVNEMRNINQKLVETVLKFDSAKDINGRFGNAGTVVRCCYSPVAVSKDLKHQVLASSQKFPVLSVRVLVPVDYPSVGPVFLTRFDSQCSCEDEECRDLLGKAKGVLRGMLRTAPERLSLGEMAKAWDQCARFVYAEHVAGEYYSSRYGDWEDCPI